jgi:glycosyltransferase involved in cell wall biosynthesis
MRVLHWFPNYFRGGGVANAVTGLAHAQAATGIEVAVAGVSEATPPIYGPHAVDSRIDLLGWKSSWTRQVGGLLFRKPTSECDQQLRKWRPDVVHVHAEFAPDNVWATRLFECPLVLSFHGALHPEVFRKGKSFRKRLYLEAAKRLLYRKVDLFHALSPAEADQIEAILPDRTVVTIPIGSSTPLPDEVIDCSLMQPQVNRGLNVLYVGRLDLYTKGLDLLVGAFAEAKRAQRDRIGTLTLVGPDWRNRRHEIERAVLALGLGAAVIFTGGVPTSDVGRYLRNSDLYVQLSRHDAFPLSVVDALVAGKPAVLSSAIGTTSYREISSLPHVRVVDPKMADAAAALVDLVVHYSDVIEAARVVQPEVLDFFSWSRIATRFVDAYRVPSPQSAGTGRLRRQMPAMTCG